jgi:hypothetical protein
LDLVINGNDGGLMARSRTQNAAPKMGTALTIATAALLLAALTYAPAASAASVPLDGGATRVTIAGGLEKALRQEGVAIKPLGPAKLKGRQLTLPVVSGTFDPDRKAGTFVHLGGFSLVSGGRAIAVRQLSLDASAKSLTATVAGKRMRFATIGAEKLEREGFNARLKANGLPLTRAAAAALNRLLGLPKALRAGRSLGVVDSLGEPSEVEIDSGTISIGGPETAFSKLESLNVQMGIWGATGRWRAGTENYFLFGVAPTRVAADASAGVLEGAENDGVTMQIHASPPRELLLRHPRIDLTSGELSATLSPISKENPVTGTIGTLDYSAARFQIRPRVGAFELMPIPVIANQFIADQLNQRFATPGMFQAGEVLARVSVTLHARSG